MFTPGATTNSGEFSDPRGAEPCLDEARNFIASGKSLVCTYGRLALKKDHVHLMGVDLSPDSSPRADYENLKVLFTDRIRAKDARGEAIVLVDKTSPATHDEGFRRTWELYRRMHVANALLSSKTSYDGEAIPALEQAAQRQTETAQPFSNANYFFSSALPQIGSERYLLTSMGPAYFPEHPRYAPVALHVLVKKSDFEGVMRNDPRGVDNIRQQVRSRIPMSYNGLIPYLFPEDPSCMPDQSKVFLSAARYDPGAQFVLERALRDDTLPRVDREQIVKTLEEARTKTSPS
ncbi:MAG: hypothetical protein KDD70_15265 [Bdellovibrionales bacterium]|nr:hypothetical protein [Bdellovibrionales bacterium]